MIEYLLTQGPLPKSYFLHAIYIIFDIIYVQFMGSETKILSFLRNAADQKKCCGSQTFILGMIMAHILGKFLRIVKIEEPGNTFIHQKT